MRVVFGRVCVTAVFIAALGIPPLVLVVFVVRSLFALAALSAFTAFFTLACSSFLAFPPVVFARSFPLRIIVVVKVIVRRSGSVGQYALRRVVRRAEAVYNFTFGKPRFAPVEQLKSEQTQGSLHRLPLLP